MAISINKLNGLASVLENYYYDILIHRIEFTELVLDSKEGLIDEAANSADIYFGRVDNTQLIIKE